MGHSLNLSRLARLIGMESAMMGTDKRIQASVPKQTVEFNGKERAGLEVEKK